jgi:mycothiol system anti-sigma-R factor
MITCSQAVKELWDYLEGAIEGPEREALEEHLGTCRRCCGEMEFADELRGFLAANASDELPDEIRERLQSHLNAL